MPINTCATERREMNMWPDFRIEPHPEQLKRQHEYDMGVFMLDIINDMDLWYYQGMPEKQKREYEIWRYDYVMFTVGIPSHLHHSPTPSHKESA